MEPKRIPMKSIVAMTAALLALALAGCGTIVTAVDHTASAVGNTVADWTPHFIKPYHPDVPQGNIVTREMVEQLRSGMSPDQVRFLLGTPLLTSSFRTDRWDYLYFLKRKDGTTQERNVVVYFRDGKLDRYEAGELPPETLADNLILGRKPQALPKPPPKEPSEDQITLPTSK
jgi:outer membrane protein assembly factor BamE